MSKFILLIIGLSFLTLLGGFYELLNINLHPNTIHNLVSQQKATFQQPVFGTIPYLRNRTYSGSDITIEQTLSKQASYTPYVVSYKSDNLKIYAAMNIPDGKGPFPVIILNHGYYNPKAFQTGDGTKAMADILATHGYLTLASDYRGNGNSEGQGGGHNPVYSIDVLNLLASVKNLPQTDKNRIGMWGHSMGGEVSLRAVEAATNLKALVLWAPTSANSADNSQFYGRGRSSSSSASLNEISPANYLQYINVPISLHQGLSDTEVKPEWSRNLDEALKKVGKQVEYFEYLGQDHNFQNLGWGEIAPRTVSFFDKYLKVQR